MIKSIMNNRNINVNNKAQEILLPGENNNQNNSQTIRNNKIMQKPEKVNLSKAKELTTKVFNLSWIMANQLIHKNQIPIFINNNVEIYSIPSFSHISTIQGHIKAVSWLIEVNDNKIITSSHDNSIKIWNYHKNKKIQYTLETTLNFHSSSVLQVIGINNNKFASCSWDSSIKVWDIVPPYTCYYTLKISKYGLTSILLLSNGLLVSGSVDSQLSFWNLDNQKCEHLVKGIYCCSQNSLKEISKNRLIVGGINGISLINIHTFQLELKIIFYEVIYFYSFLVLRDRSLLCGCQKGNLLQIDLKTHKKISLINTNKNGSILGIISFGDKQFISASSGDGVISIWEY